MTKKSEQLEQIQQKIEELQKLDANLYIFGAHKHKYQFNPCLTEKEIQTFEEENSIQLPSGYREFLLHIGNGGAGPYYGLEPLENGRFSDLDYKDPGQLIDLSRPFPHTAAWNMDFETLPEEEENGFFEKYYDDEWAKGLLRISNYGCGTTMNLVVNGSEYGNIWVDDRCNEQGIYPDPFFDSENRLSFLQWYEHWLDESIKEVMENHHATS
ncbi:SMI1/KNR4 family protein [Rapidithrix thailandica]|uniref:SMI1/KNR4 family protein n=1 Tax=Rapidithrix thailandica TaxID=413964 RepID=A0AAW9S8K3_9BACT